MADRIGLLGGTFDPVHKGHISIFRSFISSGLLDELWILLTPDPPHKTDKNHASYSDRLKMLQLAVENEHSISISTFENDLPKPSYTIQTIRELKNQFPDKTFLYCIGGDSLLTFHLWKEYDRILQETELLVAERPEFDHSKVSEEVLSYATVISHNPLEVSSSEIRKRVHTGKSISDLVPPQVEDYILGQSLYKQ